MYILLSVVAAALAGPTDPAGPRVPAAGIATEGGPGALWVNPANMAYDPDSRSGFFFSRELSSRAGPTSAALVTGVSGVGIGVHRYVAEDYSSWTLETGSGIQLPKRVAVGFTAAWHLVEGGRNHVAYDIGAAWRPLPWIGVGAVAHDIASPDPDGVSFARSGAGLALRPLGRALLFGVDYEHVFDPSSPTDTVRGTVRVRPARGLFLRASGDTNLDFTAGIELFVGKWGAGGYASGGLFQDGFTAFVGTDEPGEALFRARRRVAAVLLEETPPYQAGGGLLADPSATWLDLLELMRRVDEDPSVKGVLIALDGADLSWARARELRDRILALEAGGRPVTVYLNARARSDDYYVASAASRIVLHPAQELYLTGVASEQNFLRGAFDIIGVEPDFVRRSEYKSAVEQYTATEPSGPSAEQTAALLDAIYDELVDGIASGRDVARDDVVAWIDGGPWSAEEALGKGLVDATAYPDELEAELETTLDGDVKVFGLLSSPQPRSGWEAPKQIAVVYVNGAIVSGESSGGGLLSGITAGSRTIVRQLEAAADDPLVRAVVLRVDSPGGSSFASDEIWRAVERVKEDDKPVVVSMGGVAASGGYYVAAGADAIWAEPNTITGSIGVYTGKFAVGGALERIGIGTTTAQRGRNALVDTASRPWDPIERARMEAMVEHTYTQFKERVAEGRDLTPEQVEAVARGRVWSGVAAKENGLVDELGGLEEAIADARERAGIRPGRSVSLVSYTNRGTLVQSLSPTLLRVAVRDVVSSFRPTAMERTLSALVPSSVDPLLVMATHPEEQIWMMAPWTLEVTP